MNHQKRQINSLLIENAQLKAKFTTEQRKRNQQRNTILSLRKEVDKFKKKISRQEIQIRKLKQSIFETDLDVRIYLMFVIVILYMCMNS